VAAEKKRKKKKDKQKSAIRKEEGEKKRGSRWEAHSINFVGRFGTGASVTVKSVGALEERKWSGPLTTPATKIDAWRLEIGS
jgi:hypothetical protein